MKINVIFDMTDKFLFQEYRYKNHSDQYIKNFN